MVAKSRFRTTTTQIPLSFRPIKTGQFHAAAPMHADLFDARVNDQRANQIGKTVNLGAASATCDGRCAW
jgi:hypothetical protein